MTGSRFIPLPDYREYPLTEMKRRASDFFQEMARRRTVRQFSARGVPREIIENCLRAAGTSPSGANQQPWHFVVVADPAVKRKIRLASEREEREFYERRAPREWLGAVDPLGTGPEKPFLDLAPFLIAVFTQRHGIAGSSPDEKKIRHYYPVESVGLATGILITALHHAGLATLTYSPSPMGFLNEILDRPKNERPFLLLVVGYPAEGATVPDIGRKDLSQIATFI